MRRRQDVSFADQRAATVVSELSAVHYQRKLYVRQYSRE